MCMRIALLTRFALLLLFRHRVAWIKPFLLSYLQQAKRQIDIAPPWAGGYCAWQAKHWAAMVLPCAGVSCEIPLPRGGGRASGEPTRDARDRCADRKSPSSP